MNNNDLILIYLYFKNIYIANCFNVCGKGGFILVFMKNLPDGSYWNQDRPCLNILKYSLGTNYCFLIPVK